VKQLMDPNGGQIISEGTRVVQINNTDAEGRLTLADALWFAQEKCKVCPPKLLSSRAAPAMSL